MLFLEVVIIRTKRLAEAAKVKREPVRRLLKYLEDVPKDWIKSPIK
jgi:hypothetical protein